MWKLRSCIFLQPHNNVDNRSTKISARLRSKTLGFYFFLLGKYCDLVEFQISTFVFRSIFDESMRVSSLLNYEKLQILNLICCLRLSK